MKFGDEIEKRRILIENRADIFGDQLIMNGQDEVIGEEKYLLSNATSVTIDDCPKLASEFSKISPPVQYVLIPFFASRVASVMPFVTTVTIIFLSINSAICRAVVDESINIMSFSFII